MTTYYTEDTINRQLELDSLMKALGNDLQGDIETSVKELGASKFSKNEERIRELDGFGATSVGKKLSNAAIAGFVQEFEDYIQKQQEQTSKSTMCQVKLHEELDPVQIGRIVIRTLLNTVMRPSDRRLTVCGVAAAIGKDIEIAIKQMKLDIHHEKDVKKLMDMLGRQERTGDKEEVNRMMMLLAQDLEIDHKDWDKATSIRVGQSLLTLFYGSKVGGLEDTLFSEIFDEYREAVHGGTKMANKFIRITEKGLAWIRENEEFMSSMSMSYLPMVIPPKDWTNPFNGGYHDAGIRKTYSLIKGNRTDMSELYEQYPQGFDVLMKAINNIQKTPFRVNEYVLNAVKYVHDNQIDLDCKGVPRYAKAYHEFLGVEKTEEYFSLRKSFTRDGEGRLIKSSLDALLSFARSVVEDSTELEDKLVWKEWSKIRKNITKFAEGDNSKKILLDNVIRDAGRFLNVPIFFGYNADYRGRIYPLSGQFSPQGSDTSRGLLQFSDGVKPESMKAIDSIAIEIANNYGVDKVSFEDRVMWTEMNTDEILACAKSFETTDFWKKADKPFLFLAGCREWKKVIEARESGDPLNFISTMPIGFDGSCNGIQHYSAMFLDPVGASAVNLVNHAVPADVYKEVGDKALELCRSKNSRIAKLTLQVSEDLGHKIFGRDVAKRSVMCLPYGVSQSSSNKYVYEMVEKHMKGYKKVTAAQKKSIRSMVGKLVWEAITCVVEKPVTGKEYFQAIATELAEAGSGLTWITPTGMPVKQMLMKKDVKYNKIRVTVNGKTIHRHYPKYTKEIDAREQANAIAPNFVHSFDSSHLQLTVNAAADEGMSNFLFIHDSFATDCNSAQRFNDIIREEFVKMYRTDHVNEFHDRVEVVLGKKSEVSRQVMGDFKLEEVLSARYFFA